MIRSKRQPQPMKIVLNEKLRQHIERELAARAANQASSQGPFPRRAGGNKISG